ncbi:MAG: hypothetical protein BWK80_58590 [Desulfobacteraceae bacterium IS3]|nr:MAG: hypothetical protein BWK80_58590 [Desulfobacteraceae bacterium IS3]
MLKQEVMNMIGQLSYTQLQKVSDYIKILSSQTEETISDDEQKELLDLLNYTIDSGRGDFAEQHHRYLYGTRFGNADVAGMGKSGVKDGSVHHDRYLYALE